MSAAGFDELRPKLFAIAYRMTGSAADADDAVQDAWLRWQGVDTTTVADPEAYLVRVVTRLCLDRLGSARSRRERYVGPWLPEPLVAAAGDDPAEATELADSLTFAFLVLLDELEPVERAVLLLHDVFGYSFDEIAASTGRTAAACRQMASRTRKRLAQRREQGGAVVSREHQRRTLEGFVMATMHGDVAQLMTLMAPDVVQLDDGGALRRAARRPVVGPDRVARFMVNLARRMAADPSYTVEFEDVNGRLGMVVWRSGRAEMVFAFGWSADGRINRIWGQINPEKLAHVQ